MKTSSFLKKTLAVILALTLLAPAMGYLDVNIKEVKAEETSTNDTMNVKCQVTQGVVTDTSIEKYQGKYVMRFVSAVQDYKDYREVGFKLIEEGDTKEKKGVVKTVFKRIESTTGSANGVKEEYTYSPKVINTDGEYFVTAKLPIEEAKKDTKYTVWAYGIKKDGTIVNGPERCVSVSDGLESCETINMSFQNTSNVALKVNDTLNANDLDATVIGVSKDGATVHVRVNKPTTALKSATLFTFTKNGTEVGEEIFRNLNTKYTGDKTADTSWYDLYKDEDEYVVATSADLYGIADAVKSEEAGFKDKTIYVVSDIEANVGYADKTNLIWDTTKSANGELLPDGTTGTSYTWTAIANTSTRFQGVFDGQMHNISGIYLNASTAYQGFFSGTSADSTVKNLRLTNSYFYSTANQLGSIVGNGMGTLDTIYSDAIIEGVTTTKDDFGGLVGSTSSTGGVNINNCWFDGWVGNRSNAVNNFGGMIGKVYKSSSLSNCLNTGTISMALTDTPRMGGMVGYVHDALTVSNCVNLGNLVTKSNATTQYGMIAGYLYNSPTVSLHNSYSSPQGTALLVYSKDDTSFSDSKVVESVTDMHGTDAITTMPNLFSFVTNEDTFENESYWAIVPEGAPVLASFADTTREKYLAVDTSWYDKEQDEFTLKDSGDLYGFALLSRSNAFTNKVIKLGADITVNEGNVDDWSSTAPDFSWLSIGGTNAITNTTTPRFDGVFDGQMHTIRGIYLNATSQYQGLFSGTSANAEIRNFYLKNSYFTSTGHDYLGSVAGNAMGTFERIYSDAIVASYGGCDYVGGIIGITSDSGGFTMDDCWFAGSATINGAASYLGGLVGRVSYSSTIKNCLNTGIVDHKYSVSTAGIGGFVGHAAADVSISDSVNYSNPIRIEGTYYGLFIGRPGGTITLTNSHSISHSKYLVGSSSGTEDNSSQYPTCSRQNASDVAGLKALTADKVKELFLSATAKGHWSITKDSLPVLTIFENGCNITAQAVDTSWYDEAVDEYILMDSGDLYGFALLSQTNTFEGKIIKLGADIVVNEGVASDWKTTAPDFAWLSIGNGSTKFGGKFDGQMYTISGLYQNSANQLQGFFSDVARESKSDVVITNFSLLNSYFMYSGPHDMAFIGAVAGRASGQIENVYNNAIVESTAGRNGGLVGCVSDTVGITLINCWNQGAVSGAKAGGTGGLIGYVQKEATLKNCLNSGNISTTAELSTLDVGGIIGTVYSQTGAIDMDNCLNTGEINYVAVEEMTNYGMIAGAVHAQTTFNAVYTVGQEETPTYYYNGATTREDLTFTIDQLKGTNALTNIPALFTTQKGDGTYESYWSVVPNSTPVLTTFSEFVGDTSLAIDTSWYDKSNSYTLNDAADLYGFAMLSRKSDVNGFDGATFTLASDIKVNDGDADSWNEDVAPDYEWLCIAPTEETAFNGKFNGNGKTISGIYLNDTSIQFAGLFGVTGSQSEINNLKITDSYLYSNIRIGSIVGEGSGTISDVYSDATVVSLQKFVGGLVGMAYNGITMSNCWFDGNVTNLANSDDNNPDRKQTGGLIGCALNGKLRMSNCLNSGVINVEAYTYDQNPEEAVVINPLAGGLIGYVAADVTESTIQSCLNVGEIICHDTVNNGCGPIIGYSSGEINILRTYATEECVDYSNIEEKITKRSKEKLLGEQAETEMPLLDWENEWECREGKYPGVQFSGTGFKEYEIDIISDASNLTSLYTLYSGYQLSQGELHDHANNGPVTDGTCTLTEWKEQMQNLNLDFAASLDHQSVSHIERKDWDKDLFIYGTEAGGNVSGISDDTTDITYHYNMIFTKKDDLVAVLTSDKSINDSTLSSCYHEFGYDQRNELNEDNYIVEKGTEVGYREFLYPSFTKDGFKTLIQLVKDNDGFFAIAHPTVSHPYTKDNVLDYYFADEIGFEVVYGSMDSGNTRKAYSAWKQLLKNGARVWATAGYDGHAQLTANTLTSMYAATNDYTTKSEAYVANLTDGNFTAGAVGIQMCVGDTQMGQMGEFEDENLEIGIGEMHSTYYDESHKYRVSVWYEDSIMYSQEFTPQNTIDQMVYLSIPADSKCKYYRVEIYDITTDTCIAYGNPIWNSAHY